MIQGLAGSVEDRLREQAQPEGHGDQSADRYSLAGGKIGAFGFIRALAIKNLLHHP